MNTPTPMNTHHVCYEGTLACSGCNPCPHCLNVVNREVLALAMRRTTEVITQARGPHGAVAVAELDTQNFWAIFYGHYGEAWRNLHTAMLNDPKVHERAYDLRNIPGFEQTGGYVPPLPVAAPPVATPPVPVPSPIVPLSALVPQATYVPGVDPALQTSWALPGQRQVNADGSHVQEMDMKSAYPFTLRDAPAPGDAPGVVPSSAPVAPPDDAAVEPLAVATPSDIRRAITSDDIVASATVLDEGAAPAPSSPSTNGLASTSSV